MNEQNDQFNVDQKRREETAYQKQLGVGVFCHHRGEQHELRIAFDGKSRRCIHCGLYFELESKFR